MGATWGRGASPPQFLADAVGDCPAGVTDSYSSFYVISSLFINLVLVVFVLLLTSGFWWPMHFSA